MKFRELSINEFTSFLEKSEQESFLQSPKMDDVSLATSYYVGVLVGKKVVAAARLISRKNRLGYYLFAKRIIG